jgi:hypothetical protein
VRHGMARYLTVPRHGRWEESALGGGDMSLKCAGAWAML